MKEKKAALFIKPFLSNMQKQLHIISTIVSTEKVLAHSKLSTEHMKWIFRIIYFEKHKKQTLKILLNKPTSKHKKKKK